IPPQSPGLRGTSYPGSGRQRIISTPKGLRLLMVPTGDLRFLFLPMATLRNPVRFHKFSFCRGRHEGPRIEVNSKTKPQVPFDCTESTKTSYETKCRIRNLNSPSNYEKGKQRGHKKAPRLANSGLNPRMCASGIRRQSATHDVRGGRLGRSYCAG